MIRTDHPTSPTTGPSTTGPSTGGPSTGPSSTRPTSPVTTPHDVPWPTSGQRMQAPDASAPHRGDASASSRELLDQAARGAHDTVDRLAESAAPAVQKLSDGAEAASDMIHEKTARLREMRETWTRDARSTVRDHPLAAVAVAFVVGAVFGRLKR